MNQPDPTKELYLGCECMDLGHVLQLIYFPPTEEEKKKIESGKFLLLDEDDDINIIYLSVSVRNYFDVFIPPIINIFDSYS
jgi:hypothetical protein